MKTNNLLKQDGILLLNKSVGMTSNTALQKAKRLLGAKKWDIPGVWIPGYGNAPSMFW